jgi:hypothetical protein
MQTHVQGASQIPQNPLDCCKMYSSRGMQELTHLINRKRPDLVKSELSTEAPQLYFNNLWHHLVQALLPYRPITSLKLATEC